MEVYLPPRSRQHEPHTQLGSLRQSISSLAAGQSPKRSLRVRASYYLGSISFILFIVLVVTGILLMFYYHPAAPHAYRDMKDLQFVVSNGVLLRNLHRLAAH